MSPSTRFLSRRPRPAGIAIAVLACGLAVLSPALVHAQADVLAPAQTSVAELFDLLPADAELVLIVPSAGRLSDQLEAFGQSSGLDRLAPELGDALNIFKRQMDFDQGLDDDGAMLVVVSGYAAMLQASANGDDEIPDPQAVILAAVSDYPAFVAQLGGDPEAQGVTPVTLAGRSPGAIKPLPPYAVLGTPPRVEAYTPAATGGQLLTDLGPLLSRPLADSSVIAYVNLKTLGPALRAQAARAVEQYNDPDHAVPQAYATLMGLGFYDTLSRTLDEGGDALVLGLSLTDSGLAIDAGLQLPTRFRAGELFLPPRHRHSKNSPPPHPPPPPPPTTPLPTATNPTRAPALPKPPRRPPRPSKPRLRSLRPRSCSRRFRPTPTSLPAPSAPARSRWTASRSG